MDRSIAALRRLEQNHADDMRYNNQFIYWAWQINRCRDRIIQYQQELQLRQVEYAEQQRYRRRQRKDDDDDEPQSGGITAAGSFAGKSNADLLRDLAYIRNRLSMANLTSADRQQMIDTIIEELQLRHAERRALAPPADERKPRMAAAGIFDEAAGLLSSLAGVQTGKIVALTPKQRAYIDKYPYEERKAILEAYFKTLKE